MNRKPLSYPPQMRIAAHLPSSPHFNDVADIVANLKAFMSDAIAVSAKKAIARRNKADAREKALADEANERRFHKAACTLQEAAAVCACQEVAAARARCQQLLDKQIARARHNDNNDDDDYDDDDAYNDDDDDDDDDYNVVDDNDNDDDDGDDDDDDDDNDNNAEDEYNDVASQLKAYAATLFARVDATMAEIQAMDDGFENRAATRKKALADKLRQAAAWENVLADKANELRQAAAWEKVLADEADKLRQAAAREKALADEANEQCRADTWKKALADEAYEQRGAATRKKVLADKVNKQRCQEPSTTVDGQPQMACCCSRPRLRVGRRHGPRAPNPYEHLLCGWRHQP
jgi:hypothetical protein